MLVSQQNVVDSCLDRFGEQTALRLRLLNVNSPRARPSSSSTDQPLQWAMSHVAGLDMEFYSPHQPKILALILAGGKGERLRPLTDVRSKPAVPFGGTYRIIDFVLSNFYNSGIMGMHVMVQYRSQPLIEHLRRAWRIGDGDRQFVTVVPPQMRARGGWYEGTADAVYQNLNLIQDFNPDLVAIFGADHIYRMDIRQMVQFHCAGGRGLRGHIARPDLICELIWDFTNRSE